MRNLVLAVVTLLVATSCMDGKKSAESVFKAIEENPARFVEVSRKAFMEAEKKSRAGEFEKLVDEGFKNPKIPNVDGRAAKGEASAPVTIVEYSDFLCPYCAQGSETVSKVLDKYGGKVKLVFKHLPFKGAKAKKGSEYFIAIGMQDHKKAYEFKKKVFANQREVYGKADDLYPKYAKEVGADMAKLKSDLSSKKAEISKRIEADLAEAKKFGFGGTPGYLINGVSLPGAYPMDSFIKIIDRHLKK